MADNSQKLAVLKALKQKAKPISLKELLDELPPSYAERSVRRRLVMLCEAGQVIKVGKKRGTRYQAVRGEVAQRVVFHDESLAKIEIVQQPLINRDPVSYHASLLNDYKPNETYYLREITRKQLYLAGNRGVDDEPAGTYARRIYNNLLIDLSYNSSRLEGNTYTRLETEKLILQGIDAADKLDKEKLMILNHKEAIRHLIDGGNKIKIDSSEIFTLHYLLADGLVPAEYAGKLRNHGVRIGASSYIPLENPDKIKANLELICRKANAIKDPFEKSFFLLIHLSYLQAFIDVNKRTSRLASNIPLIKGNFVPLSFNDVDKEDYISALLAFYELNSPRPLEDIYCHSYLRTCKQYEALVTSFGVDELRIRYRQQRRDIVGYIIRHKLKDDQVNHYIESAIKKQIPKEDQQGVKRTIHEDLELISPSRIVGMGITKADLEKWLALSALKQKK
jgi:Fic family protein